jgi:hypothetical protein
MTVTSGRPVSGLEGEGGMGIVAILSIRRGARAMGRRWANKYYLCKPVLI